MPCKVAYTTTFEAVNLLGPSIAGVMVPHGRDVRRIMVAFHSGSRLRMTPDELNLVIIVIPDNREVTRRHANHNDG